MKIKTTIFLFTSLTILLVMPKGLAQDVTIKEETMSLDTYGFGKPNPIPILTENPKIIPYHKFESYDQNSKKKDWKVVTLENEYIKVFVLPEIGGKVWGAIEKKYRRGNFYIKMRSSNSGISQCVVHGHQVVSSSILELLVTIHPPQLLSII